MSSTATKILFTILGAIGAMAFVFLYLGYDNLMGHQRCRLLSQDPLVIEDTFEHTLYAHWTTESEGASRLALKQMESVPTPEFGPILTGNTTLLRFAKEAEEQREAKDKAQKRTEDIFDQIEAEPELESEEGNNE